MKDNFDLKEYLYNNPLLKESMDFEKLDEKKKKSKKDILPPEKTQKDDIEDETSDLDLNLGDMEPSEEPSDDTPSEDNISTGFSKEQQEIQNSLKIAYDNAIKLNDEKLAEQIGNTITFFTRTHIVNRPNFDSK